MLDIKYIEANRDEVEKALLKRMEPEALNLDALLEAYEDYKESLASFEEKRREQKGYNDEMATMNKKSDEFKSAIAKLKELAASVKEFDAIVAEKKAQLDDMLSRIPNIPDEDIPAGGKENNEVLHEWGEEKAFDFEIKDHVEVGEALGILDFERAAKIAGAHMALYMGKGAVMEWALINYFIRQHLNDGYECVIPPHLLEKESAYVAGQLPKFQEEVYWTQDGQCLLPTAETALCNLHREEILEENDLPKKYFAFTPCYRREVGGYGKEERGLLRTHQFNKVEIFQYTTADLAMEAFNEMIEKAEKLVQGLGLRYRLSKLAAADMSFGMVRTYDIEIYLPYQKIWKEVSSASNCGTFQSRRGNMRYRSKSGEVQLMYTLNASGLATSRVMPAILETYQNADGSVTVPEVLRDYVGVDRIEKK